MWRRSSGGSAATAGRWRMAVLVVALAATAYKLQIAATTFGTNDIQSWTSFAEGVRERGYVGAYGFEYYTQYNHPPLSGAFLVLVNTLVDAGLGDLPFLVRLPASVADIGTALVVFELIRQHRTAAVAGTAGVLVGLSPALITISGFHGNSDPVFVMFALLSVYFMAARGWGFAAGVAFALSLSIKLIPIVLLPMLLVIAVRGGWRTVVASMAGGLAVAVPLWGPVLLGNWAAFSADVLGYSGVTAREWGLPQYVLWAGGSEEWIDWLAGPGRFVALGISSLVPAAMVWWRPAAVGPAVGLGLASFLMLSPAFGMQYLIWPLAAAYLVGNGIGTVYNVTVSWWILSAYSYWNGAPPGSWYFGNAQLFRPIDFALATATWVVLLAVVVVALSHSLLRRAGPSARKSGRAGRSVRSDHSDTATVAP